MTEASPHSIESEQSVLGGLMLDNGTLETVAALVSDGDFYRSDHRLIFRAIRELHKADEPFDAVTLASWLDREGHLDNVGGLPYLSSLATNTPSTANIKAYANIVREQSLARQLLETVNGIEDATRNPQGLTLDQVRTQAVQSLEAIPFTAKRRFRLLDFHGLQEITPGPSRIRGILPATGTASVWGASTTGKSFLAIHQACHIADGADWFGYRTTQAPVVYCVLEGEHGVPKRVLAHAKQYGEPRNLMFLFEPLNLLNPSDVDQLAATALGAGAKGGVIYIDTLNRAAVGEENSSEYGAGVLAACKRLATAIDGLVTFVHHSGKDASRGLRGHSSIFAGLDAGIEVIREHSHRSWRIAKSKDDADEGSHSFRLDVVELGHDEEGDPITSCVVVPTDEPAAITARAKAPTGGNQKIIWDALGDLFKTSAHFGTAGAPPTRAAIKLDDAITHSRGRLPCSTDRQTERARQAITGLISRGLLEHQDGWIWCQ